MTILGIIITGWVAGSIGLLLGAIMCANGRTHLEDEAQAHALRKRGKDTA